MTAKAEGRPRARIRIAGPGDAAALLRPKRRLDLQTALYMAVIL